MLEKLAKVHRRGVQSLQIARAEGVPVVFGTDLLGHMHDQQSGEFDLRTQAMSPVEALQSASIVAARLMRQEGQIGQLVAGAWADLRWSMATRRAGCPCLPRRSRACA